MKPTQEQVITWAREVGLFATLSLLMKFAALAYEAGRKDENEACAKVFEPKCSEWPDYMLEQAAALIRARGNH